ncbi:hypothetical protein [Streptomyces sp. NPDC047981]|uniref:hypothetical protein n=1 Tax=Streptomyces sp. NPDC047981 TaxID=3154610 RepID=UPI00343511C5
MTDTDSEIWKYRIVRCQVTEHVGDLGVAASIVSPPSAVPAFINSRFLGDGAKVPVGEFPKVGSVLDAVVLTYHESGEFRLSAQESSLERARTRAEVRPSA